MGGYAHAAESLKWQEAQMSMHQLTPEEEERIRIEGEQQYQAHLMYQAQKQYEKSLQVLQIRAEAERKAREAAEEQARREAEEATKLAEEMRLHAEKQEAERMFMRKFFGGGMSSLAPEFSPC
jgi:dTMP kinase